MRIKTVSFTILALFILSISCSRLTISKSTEFLVHSAVLDACSNIPDYILEGGRVIIHNKTLDFLNSKSDVIGNFSLEMRDNQIKHYLEKGIVSAVTRAGGNVMEKLTPPLASGKFYREAVFNTLGIWNNAQVLQSTEELLSYYTKIFDANLLMVFRPVAVAVKERLEEGTVGVRLILAIQVVDIESGTIIYSSWLTGEAGSKTKQVEDMKYWTPWEWAYALGKKTAHDTPLKFNKVKDKLLLASITNIYQSDYHSLMPAKWETLAMSQSISFGALVPEELEWTLMALPEFGYMQRDLGLTLAFDEGLEAGFVEKKAPLISRFANCTFKPKWIYDSQVFYVNPLFFEDWNHFRNITGARKLLVYRIEHAETYFDDYGSSFIDAIVSFHQIDAKSGEVLWAGIDNYAEPEANYKKAGNDLISAKTINFNLAKGAIANAFTTLTLPKLEKSVLIDFSPIFGISGNLMLEDIFTTELLKHGLTLYEKLPTLYGRYGSFSRVRTDPSDDSSEVVETLDRLSALQVWQHLDPLRAEDWREITDYGVENILLYHMQYTPYWEMAKKIESDHHQSLVTFYLRGVALKGKPLGRVIFSNSYEGTATAPK
jgi:hypothetical protein